MTAYDTPLTILEIDLAAIAANWLFFKQQLSPNTICAAVVKADAYGLGMARVAPVLQAQGCRHFFVATFDEGTALRELLQENESFIYVLNGPWGARPEEFLSSHLVPVLNTLADIEYWSAAAKRPAVIHLDTGMNRLGLPEKEDPDNSVFEKLDIHFMMSHLACADDPDHPMNARQLDSFQKRSALASRRSLANSGGILLGPEYHFDLVRPGIGLYGINPQPRQRAPLTPVVTLKSRILQLRDITPGETVGYGATWQAKKPVKAAVISAGYADGYFRSLGRDDKNKDAGGRVMVQDFSCPVLGRVSMDTIVVDVSGVAAPVVAGDWAVLLNDHYRTEDMAAAAGTIGYEVLCALGKRYKRVYRGGIE